MTKTVFKPFWSYDVVSTELWLSQMHSIGYALKRIDFNTRLFYFEKAEPCVYYYRIAFERNFQENASADFQRSGYESVYSYKNYYVYRTTNQNPQSSPSYSGFLNKNVKLKYTVGIILLFILCFSAVPAFIFIFIIKALITGNFTVEETAEETVIPPSDSELIWSILFPLGIIICLFIMIWMVYTYLKLRNTNRQLEILCGNNLNLSFTIPKENMLSKTEEQSLRRDKKLIRKTRIAWFYAPDKAEIWLEKMESMGFNLYRMSKPGNSFFFIKGQPRKVKFSVDYQNKADPQYFNLNKECGWTLIFTSLSRIQSLNVWMQEFNNEPPTFYSDKEGKLKHAKRFALTYSLCYFPLCAMYIILLLVDAFVYKNNIYLQPNTILFIILIFEFGFFATRTILYYFRIKKSFKI